jgi:hypothetical protein
MMSGATNLLAPSGADAAIANGRGGTARWLLTCAAQAVGLLALHFVWFGALLPALWADAGFPALVELAGLRESIRLDAFEDIASGAWGGLPRVAFAAASVHTGVIVAGVAGGTLIKLHLGGIAPSAGGQLAPVLATATAVAVLSAVVVAAAFFAARQLFAHSFEQGWGFGFDYGYHFFDRAVAGAAGSFGTVAAASISWELALALVFRICARQYHGLYPSFAHAAVSRALAAFAVSYPLFRYIVAPAAIAFHTSATATQASPGDGGDGGGGGGDATGGGVAVAEWAAESAGVHTVSLALGMVCAFLVHDVLSTAAASSASLAAACLSRARYMLRFAVVAALASAFFAAVQARVAAACCFGAC